MLQIRNYTEKEQEAIDELKKRTIQELTPRMLEDETLFYRFLKARDFKLKPAEDLLRKHLSDRKLYDFEKIVKDYTPTELQYLRTYIPSSFMGYDKEGSVVRYIDVGGIDVKGSIHLFEFRKIIYHITDYLEKDIDRMAEQSRKSGKPVTQLVHIMNFDKSTLFQATYKKGIDWVMDISKFYQDNYPERNKAFYVINANFYFYIAFRIIKTTLPPSLLNKIHVFGRTGWQEALLEVIDADELPAFLGGNRTDPDGNPLCTSFIVHGKKIPEELYAKKHREKLSQKPGAKKLTVTRFSSSEIVLNVFIPNTDIEWEFETKTRDIAFGLYYKDDSKKDVEMEELIQKQRIDTMLTSETGVYRCTNAGTYIIVFDNSYSWMFSKEIYYIIRLVEPDERSIENKSN